MLARWKPTERAARVANGFERRRPFVVTSVFERIEPFPGVSIWPDNGPPAGYVAAVQAAERRQRGSA